MIGVFCDDGFEYVFQQFFQQFQVVEFWGFFIISDYENELQCLFKDDGFLFVCILGQGIKDGFVSQGSVQVKMNDVV